MPVHLYLTTPLLKRNRNENVFEVGFVLYALCMGVFVNLPIPLCKYTKDVSVNSDEVYTISSLG